MLVASGTSRHTWTHLHRSAPVVVHLTHCATASRVFPHQPWVLQGVLCMRTFRFQGHHALSKLPGTVPEPQKKSARRRNGLLQMGEGDMSDSPWFRGSVENALSLRGKWSSKGPFISKFNQVYKHLVYYRPKTPVIHFHLNEPEGLLPKAWLQDRVNVRPAGGHRFRGPKTTVL